MSPCIAFHEHIAYVNLWRCHALLLLIVVRIYERIDNSKARGENLNVVYSLVIQPTYLWLWVIRHCEVLAASLLIAVLYVPFQLADKHKLPDVRMETFNDQ